MPFTTSMSACSASAKNFAVGGTVTGGMPRVHEVGAARVRALGHGLAGGGDEGGEPHRVDGPATEFAAGRQHVSVRRRPVAQLQQKADGVEGFGVGLLLLAVLARLGVVPHHAPLRRVVVDAR